MIKQLYNEFIKNIKIMFRNWTSLSLLIIAPLVLILLVGYAFSGEDVNGVKIGIISGSNISLQPLADKIGSGATIVKYDTVEACKADMILEKAHICIEIEGNIDTIINNGQLGEVPSAKVTYYYDNTRKKVSLLLMQKMQEFFGLQSEQISIGGADAIVENIQNLLVFINDRKQNINSIKNESMAVRQDLVDRKAKLEGIRDDFEPSYVKIKMLQKEIHLYQSRMNNASGNINGTINATVSALKDMDNIINTLNPVIPLNFSLFTNVTNITAGFPQKSQILKTSSDLKSRLNYLSGNIGSATSNINDMVFEIDSIVEKIDTIKVFLDEEIVRNDDYIKRIDSSIVKIDEATAELDSKLVELNKVNPDLAQKIVKPISYNYDMTLKDLKNIQLTFPQLSVIIIMFIALLFSNVATLIEINNKAYLRNLVAPVNDIIYVIGLFLTSTVLIFIQVLVLFAVAQFRFGISISSVFWEVCFIGALLIMFFVLLGMILAYLFRSVQSSILVTTFLALIFFLFGNTISFIESMPPIISFISSYNPLVLTEFLFRQVELYQTPLGMIMPKVWVMVSYIVVLLVLLILLAKSRNKNRG